METKVQRFAKYEGAGNDFILLDGRDGLPPLDAARIARLCDRHFGIGADGLMTLLRPAAEGCDCSMRYYNADGSAGEMCGNGGRCFALFAHHLGIGGEVKRFDSIDGLHTARIAGADALAGTVELGMIDVGQIDAGGAGDTDAAGGAGGVGWLSLNTGVPHYVELVGDVDTVDLCGRGRAIRHDLARFPEGTNVDFVTVTGPGRLRIRTYERGVEAETLACGTGAVAAAIAVNRLLQPAVSHFTIAARGGELRVDFRRTDDNRYTGIRLSGPARKVFEGHFDMLNF